jgi:acetyl esterase/lipase
MSSEDILQKTPPVPDRRLFYGADPNQFGHLRLPSGDGPFPVVMNIHGGFWRAAYDLEHAGHICAALARKGIASWNVEYRRVGNPGGGWPGTADDIALSFKYLQHNCDDLHVDSKKILVMGHSAGGHLAFWLAANNPSVTRVLGLAAVLDLQAAWKLHLSNDAVVQLLNGTPTEVPRNYKLADPMHLAIPHAKQWVVHGGEDGIVPISFAQSYVASKAKENVQLVDIPGADHFDVIDPKSPAWNVIERIIVGSLVHGTAT